MKKKMKIFLGYQSQQRVPGTIRPHIYIQALVKKSKSTPETFHFCDDRFRVHVAREACMPHVKADKTYPRNNDLHDHPPRKIFSRKPTGSIPENHEKPVH